MNNDEVSRGFTIRAVLAVLVLGSLAACVPVVSLNPYFEDGLKVFDHGLIGEWTSEDVRLSFSESGNGQYRLVIIDEAEEEKDIVLTARLFRILEGDFLELSTESGGQEPDALFVRHELPVRTLYRLEFDGDSLELAFLDDRWVAENADEFELSHLRVGDELVLTASTAALQKLIILADDEAFAGPEEFRRNVQGR